MTAVAAVETAVLEATAVVSEALKSGGVGSRSSNSTASAETAAVGETLQQHSLVRVSEYW